MTDTYQNWVERVVSGRSGKPLDNGEMVKTPSGKPFQSVEFVQIQKKLFLAEVGKKNDKYIYHFFLSDKLLGATIYSFYEPMALALLELFKREDQIESDWVEEMKAFVVRVSGWTDHIWGDELALRAVERIDEYVSERNNS